MTGLDPTLDSGALQFESADEVEISRELAASWRRLTRAATFVALLTSPALVALLHAAEPLAVLEGRARHPRDRRSPSGASLDLAVPALHPVAEPLRSREPAAPRGGRARATARLVLAASGSASALIVVTIVTVIWLFQRRHVGRSPRSRSFTALGTSSAHPQLWIQVVFVFFLFIANFAILMGPLLLMNLAQMRAFEPGDAEWGVKLDDVRGQAEAKEEVRRVVTIWQSGEAFERAGGKRERGLLFLGAPGTGKTMLAKALATGFNSPFVSMPGSGFAATFIGIDAIVVRVLARTCEEARAQVGRPVHRLHRRDRRRRHAPPGPPADDVRHRPVLVARRQRLLVLRPVGSAEPDRRPDRRDPPVA